VARFSGVIFVSLFVVVSARDILLRLGMLRIFLVFVLLVLDDGGDYLRLLILRGPDAVLLHGRCICGQSSSRYRVQVAGLAGRFFHLGGVVTTFVIVDNTVVDALSGRSDWINSFLFFFLLLFGLLATHQADLMCLLRGLALYSVAAVVNRRQVLAIFTDAGRVVVHERLVQLVLDMQGSAKSIFLSLTDSHLRVVIGVVLGLRIRFLEKALAIVHSRVARVATSIGHK